MTENGNQSANQAWIDMLVGNQPVQEVLAAAGQKQAHSQRVTAGSDTNATKLPNLHVGQGQQYGRLTWFPVWTDAAVAERKYVGANASNLKISELPTPTVGAVVAENLSDDDILLFEGMILEAGWQHRSLTRSVLVPKRSKLELPVVCVERSRWGGAGEQKIGSRVAPIRVKRAMRGIVRDQHGFAAQAGPDQGSVWSEVSQYAARHNISAANESMVDLDDKMNQRNQRLPHLAPAEALLGQRGVIVAALGKPIALELFDHPDTLAERLDSILQGYQLDVADKDYVETRGQAARDFAVAVSKAKFEDVCESDQSGRSRLKRSKRSRFAATAALEVEQSLVHLSGINPQHELVLAA